MPDGYALQDGRYIMLVTGSSAVAGLTAQTAAVPAGKVWTVIGCNGICSVAETRTVGYSMITAGGNIIMLTQPVSFAYLNSAYLGFPLTREGMEVKLWPGDSIVYCRDAATAGSTITVYARVIETDLPLYTYDEPQVVKRQKQGISQLRQVIGAAAGGSSSAGVVIPEAPPPGGGGGGGGVPVL